MHAVVVTKAAVTITELVEHCRSFIAGYKVSHSVDFVAALPLSGADKILKRELRQPYWETAASSVN